MKNKLLVFSIASIISLGCAYASSSEYKNIRANDNVILVGEAKTYEEKIQVILNEIKLNIDINNVVSDLNLPVVGLYGSTITWTSSNNDVLKIDEANKSRGLITRGVNDEHVTLTANVELKDNKDNLYTGKRDFNLTILRKVDSSTTGEQELFEEDFTSYVEGDELSEYLRWDLTSGTGGAKVVSSVPNNNLYEHQNALMIPSKKTAAQSTYVREFYSNKPTVVEGQFMFYGDINGIYFDVGRDGTFGPSIGIKNGQYAYYSNGEKISTAIAPKEGIWSKFRLEINPSLRTYKAIIYKLDGTNEVVYLSGNNAVAYSGKEKFISQFRIRIAGGSSIGQVYLTDLKIKESDELPIDAGTKLNREKGIGRIDNFSKDVLFIRGEEVNYDKGFVVHNRFNEDEIYQENVDYTIESETVYDSTGTKKLNTYKITLVETGEVKVLTQTVYIEDKENAPFIDNFKGSHLARKIVNVETGELSSTGNISIKGQVTRNDSTVYYAVTRDGASAPSKEEIMLGNASSFVKAGHFEQKTRDISYEIEGLSLDNEYALYVVIANDYGESEIYSKESISQVVNITTCEEFYDMTVNVDTYMNEFRLLNDLDFSNFDWKCELDNQLKFKGKLNGNGHTIKNLNIQSPYRKAAVFYEIGDATIKDLVFESPKVSGLQDSAVICGFSEGSVIENIRVIDPEVSYNNGEGSEGYFAIIAGRLQKGTTTMKNISIEGASISSNKYTGILTGNVNKNTDCVLNATNIYAECNIRCDGAAIGLIGRNRGTANIDNAVINLTVSFAKKEMGVVAGHNKEGGQLNVKNLIGTLNVLDCTQPTYFNYFIGSQDDNTSSYTYENVYFIQGDYSSLSESLIPHKNSRTCGVILPQLDMYTARWFEENTFIGAFEINKTWSYDESNQKFVLAIDDSRSVTANEVNALIDLIKNDGSSSDHYYIYKAGLLIESLSQSEKSKVNMDKFNEAKQQYLDIIEKLNNVIDSL